MLATLAIVGCTMPHAERQITTAPHGHLLTNVHCWTPGARRIVYDVRSDPAGSVFDGTRIEGVDVASGAVEVLYESTNDACCGVVTASPTDDRVYFILGPEHPTPDWQYGISHRQGAIVRTSRPGVIERLDARDLAPPFTPGALRGGTHVHVASSDGAMVSFTYDDAVLEALGPDAVEPNARNVGVSVLGRPVSIGGGHPRNHGGVAFSVLVTRTTATPRPGSDEISRAYEDAWVGTHGYTRADGTRQRRAIAFQGDVVTADGRKITEAFLVDLPDDLTRPGDGPLEGTPTRRPAPPRGVAQRRLTFTADRTFPGIQGPRHWLRSSPDGSRVALLMKDDRGVVQLWTVSPNGGPPTQVTRDAWPVASAFSWSPDGRRVAYVVDGSVFTVDVASGESRRLTERRPDNAETPRPEACVFSPDGRSIAFVRHVGGFNQVFIVAAGD